MGGIVGGFTKLLFGSGPRAPDYTELAKAQRYAADKQYEAAMRGIESWERERSLLRAETAPWRETGKWALDTLRDAIQGGHFEAIAGDVPEWRGLTRADLEQDEGYLFAREQGERALERRANMTGGGGVRSGAFAARLTDFNQRLATQHFDAAHERALRSYGAERAEYADRVGVAGRRYNRLAGLAGTGQTAVNQYLGMSQKITGQQVNLDQAGAAALGQGEIGYHNAIVQGQLVQNQLDQNWNNAMMDFWGTVIGAGIGFAGGG